MKSINKILVATDLLETSRHGIVYSCGLAEEQMASLIVLHVANEVDAWEPPKTSGSAGSTARGGRRTGSSPKPCSI